MQFRIHDVELDSEDPDLIEFLNKKRMESSYRRPRFDGELENKAQSLSNLGPYILEPDNFKADYKALEVFALLKKAGLYERK